MMTHVKFVALGAALFVFCFLIVNWVTTSFFDVTNTSARGGKLIMLLVYCAPVLPAFIVGKLSGRNGMIYGALLVIVPVIAHSLFFISISSADESFGLVGLVLGWAPGILAGTFGGLWGENNHRPKSSNVDSNLKA